MMNYDTVYALERGLETDEKIQHVAVAEDRLLLTRDVELADCCSSSILLTSTDTDDQLAELASAGFELKLTTPRRCSVCNGRLIRLHPMANNSAVEDAGEESASSGSASVKRIQQTPEGVPDPETQAVWRCQNCGQYFWKGSHWENLEQRLQEL
jgi:hypothetical protein